MLLKYRSISKFELPWKPKGFWSSICIYYLYLLLLLLVNVKLLYKPSDLQSAKQVENNFWYQGKLV